MWGNIFLTLGLISSVFAGIMYFLSIKGYENTLKPARFGFYVAAVSVFAASVLLMSAILNHQYELKYVFNYSNDDLPLGLLMSTFYAGQEGSFMLWLLFTVIIGLVLIKYTSSRDDLEPRVMFTFTLATFFLLVMVSPLLKSPFVYIWKNATYIDIKKINPDFFSQGFLQNFFFQDTSSGKSFIKMSPQLYAILKSAGIPLNKFIIHGRGLNPLLQNFWMQIHPPMLFIGFALTTVPFAFAMAALIKNEYKDWIRQSLPWTLAAMMVLGLAIMLGGYWSYGVLGWGGYWGWDPVENSSLIPWLVGVALIHTMLIQKKSLTLYGGIGKYARTNLILAMLTYLLVLYSTFLTRSGILGDSSVHSFVDPGAIVYFFLIVFILTFFVWGAVSLVLRWKYLEKESGEEDAFWSRELALFTGAVALLASAIIIFVGTSAPIFGQSVETRFYDEMNLPIAIIIGLLNGLSLLLKWKFNKGKDVLKSLIPPLTVSVILTLLVVLIGGVTDVMLALLSFSSIFTFVVNGQIAIRIITKKALSLGPYVTHIGMAIFFIGVLSTGGYSKEVSVDLVKGQTEQVLGYNFTFLGYSTFDSGKKYKFHVRVEKDNTVIESAPVMYISEFNGELMREPDIIAGFVKDLYITPLNYNSNGGAANKGKQVHLNKGETKTVNRVSLTFEDFYRSEESIKNMSEGKPFSIGVKIKAVKDGKTAELIPEFQMGGGQKSFTTAEAPELNLKVTLTNMNAAGSVDIIVSDLNSNINGIQPKEVFAIKASIKPFVSLIWIGVLIITLGFLIAVIKRTKESRS